ncbi:MAG: UDP-N-acetylglucosamine 2-epimerase (non-hydrolyzing) [Bacilli bacterium]|nr:UDP-N-acetylglucosamine 2-epimerase (non-hydrolyzing) [Bacilli bacterium]
MSNKIRVVTIIGTRPEIIRLSEVIKALDSDKAFEHILIHTGQNYDYELNQIFFDELGLRAPDYYLNCVGKNLGETIGNAIAKSYDLLQELNPDAVLILGDTNSALCAISAKRLKLPIFHMEAGNRCGDWNVPETINRKIVDHISDINLPYTEHAYANLMKEGIDPKYTFITGSPMLEVLNAQNEKIKASKILEELGLKKEKYIVVSSHREENIDIKKNFKKLMPAINAVAEKYQLPIIFSTHPRTRNRLEKEGFVMNSLIRNLKPLGFLEYVKLQENAMIVLSVSGTLTEESWMRHFPAVLIRTSTERPEGVEAGSIVVSGIETKEIMSAIDVELTKWKFAKCPENYDVTDVSKRVLKIIKEKIEVVNKEIWDK